MMAADDRDWSEIEAEIEAEMRAKMEQRWRERQEREGVISIQPRPLRSGSYLTAVTIIGENRLRVLGQRQLRYNEMTGRVELGASLLSDEHVSAIRANIEQHFAGGEDAAGPKGLKLSIGDVDAACRQVASENAYHPVRVYLNSLEWDGIERICSVVDDILGGEKSELNMAIIRRFFVAAVARVFEPGCKVDTMLILVGKQGKLKSSFFRVLASPKWFSDSEIDISKKDAYEQLRMAWIYEWPELSALFRARDANSVKAFLASPVDTYRPSYGRNVVKAERTCIIVGSTNDDEFLTDETGNRRFHPLRVGDIQLGLLLEQRDQLWAEAVALYRAKEQWWLTPEEDIALHGVHEEHRVRDAWEDKVVAWTNSYMVPFTTADVLEKALEKPTGQWGRADEMRIAKVLKARGWVRRTDSGDNNRKTWRKEPT